MSQKVGAIQQVQEMFLPLVLLAIVASMLLPMPVMVLDFLLVGNLVFALLLLLSALYVTDPLKLSSLPTILLMTTLYRLALNVSTTRLILSSEDSSAMIEAFGQVVMSGSLIVGVVIFLVVTLIQFIVIAKGAERVAEVSARFTLDALPGKQMSIDADIRAGLLDFESAKQKRDDLQVESRFYGALDGAMKFIKGDAIAGLVITSVNIIGGIGIGVGVLSMDITQASTRYTLLTVGDGLLSQVPALLNALAAGMVVTRVVRPEKISLSGEVIHQLGQLSSIRKMLGLGALGFSFIPNVPLVPFASLGLLLLLSSMYQPRTEGSKDDQKLFEPKLPPLFFLSFTPTALRMFDDDQEVRKTLEEFRENAFDHYGLYLPPPEVDLIEEEQALVRVSIRGINAAKLSFAPEKEPNEQKRILKTTLLELVDRYRLELLDDAMTRRLLEQLERLAPQLGSSVIPNIVSVTKLTTLMRDLLAEGIPIVHLDLILQAISEQGEECSARELLMHVRGTLKRIISAKHADENKVIRAYSIPAELDLAFWQTERSQEVLDPALATQFSESLRSMEVETRLLICSKGARKLVSEVLQAQGIQFYVISFDEIANDYSLEKKELLYTPVDFPQSANSLQSESHPTTSG